MSRFFWAVRSCRGFLFPGERQRGSDSRIAGVTAGGRAWGLIRYSRKQQEGMHPGDIYKSCKENTFVTGELPGVNTFQ